jgi:hypothetical protein
MGDIRKAFDVLVGKSEWKRPLRICGCKWEDNIRIDLREIEW